MFSGLHRENEQKKLQNVLVYVYIQHICHYVNSLFLKPPISPFPNIRLMILKPRRLGIDLNSKNVSDVTEQAKD